MKKVITLILTVLLLSVTAYALPEVYEIPMACEYSPEAYGVWQVPCIGTRSPLYFTRGSMQEIIDEENAALIRRYGKGYAIYDHADSYVGLGYWRVDEMQVGCGGFLCREGKPEAVYECTAIYLAEQKGDAYYWHGKKLAPGENEILCLSCADEDGWVCVAVFEFIGEMP